MTKRRMDAQRSFLFALLCALIGAAGIGLIAATSQDNPLAALLFVAYLLGCVPALIMLYFASARFTAENESTADKATE